MGIKQTLPIDFEGDKYSIEAERIASASDCPVVSLSLEGNRLCSVELRDNKWVNTATNADYGDTLDGAARSAFQHDFAEPYRDNLNLVRALRNGAPLLHEFIKLRAKVETGIIALLKECSKVDIAALGDRDKEAIRSELDAIRLALKKLDF